MKLPRVGEALDRFERNLPEVELQAIVEGANGPAYAADAWLLVAAARAWSEFPTPAAVEAAAWALLIVEYGATNVNEDSEWSREAVSEDGFAYKWALAALEAAHKEDR